MSNMDALNDTAALKDSLRTVMRANRANERAIDMLTQADIACHMVMEELNNMTEEQKATKQWHDHKEMCDIVHSMAAFDLNDELERQDRLKLYLETAQSIVKHHEEHVKESI